MPQEVWIGVVIGLVSGVVGGLAGLGGSIIMLPALGLVLGYSGEEKSEHHTYMAAAMMVNVVVALASVRKHRKRGAIDGRLTSAILPAMVAGIVAGVVLSNLLAGGSLRWGLAAFLGLFCAYSIFTVVVGLPDHEPEDTRYARPLLWTIGGGTGVVAGLLGIGGGVLLVPLLQVAARVPVRRAVAGSASVMWLTALIGATLKTATLGEHGQSAIGAVVLALPMAAGAVVGATAGATLTHGLKLPVLRAAIAAILAAAGLRLVGII